MISSLIILTCLAADGAELQAQYRDAKAKAGRNADAQVQLALWCESHGMTAERLEHLAHAVVLDPANASARALLGMVADAGRWRRPEDVTARVRQDPALMATLADYAERRGKAANTADSQWRLAIWCEENGLKDEARAHLTAVVRLDPSREAAWKRLGCKKVDGRWVNDDQIAATKAESEAQKAADRHWKPRLDKLRADLRKPSKRADAAAEIARITEPRAVPALLRVLGTGDAGDLSILVQVLGQIQGVSASRALATIAMGAEGAEVRRLAGETLRGRDAREYADLLIAAIRPQVKYKVQPVGGPGSPGVLLVEGEKFDRRRFYAPPPMPTVQALSADDIWVIGEDGSPILLRYQGSTAGRIIQRDELIRESQAPAPSVPAGSSFDRQVAAARAAGRRDEARSALGMLDSQPVATRVEERTPVYDVIDVGAMQRETMKVAATAQAQLEADVAAIDAYNRSARAWTERATDVLRDVSGEDHREDRAAWSKWATDLRGYALVLPPTTDSRPIVDEQVPIGYTPSVPAEIFVGPTYLVPGHSCFAAGTSVPTKMGDRPIERLAVGDLVLVQDTTTGRLGFEPIVAVYHNSPNRTLKINLGSETIVATAIHRFWKAGRGWTMARELKPGDSIRTADGIAKVVSVEPEKVQPVFNLEVARGRSFFVGKLKALVHDNSLVETVARPFDAAPALAVGKPK